VTLNIIQRTFFNLADRPSALPTTKSNCVVSAAPLCQGRGVLRRNRKMPNAVRAKIAESASRTLRTKATIRTLRGGRG